MNCANHADASAVAYCRTCGKALCANCTRPVRGVIYCEDCLGAKMEGASGGRCAGFMLRGFVHSAAVRDAVPPRRVRRASGSGPNPTVAGILAGFFPFGVGAVYTGQYAKGLAHLAIFVLAHRRMQRRRQRALDGSGRYLRARHRVLRTSTRSSTRCARRRRSRWRSRYRILWAWRRLLAAGRRSRRARFRWARSCSFCWACSSCCIRWA